MKIKNMLACALAAITLAGVASLAAAPASAHTPEASATCSTLTVALTNYTAGPYGEPDNNLTVAIDSTVVADSDFGASMRGEYPLGDPEVAHEYRVEVDAKGTQYDREFSGTSVPCREQLAADASAILAVDPATCESSGSLVLGDVENAAWGTPTTAVGPGQYSVTATAVAGHAFPDGTTSKSFAGTLDGRLDPAAAVCSTSATPPLAATPPTVASPPAATPPPVVATPPANPVTAVERVVPVSALAETGSDAGTVAPIGVGVVLLGIALMLVQRVRTRRAVR